MVYRLATEMKLNGYVKNGNDGVHVLFNAGEDVANLFFKKLKQEAPAQSKIISSHLQLSSDKIFTDFSIVVRDDDRVEKKTLLSPDKAICTQCRKELHDENNRRYRYPFITCTQCGPRYSIIKNLPYERQGTSMQKFTQC